MQVDFKESFQRDLKKIKGQKLLNKIAIAIKDTENVSFLSEIRNLKKLKAEKGYYCIRIGDYRLGVIIKEKTIIFVRALHRKEIYRYFP